MVNCQRFNIGDIAKGTNSLIVGRRLGGKSTVMVSIIQSRPDAVVYVFASKYVASSYCKYLPKSCIYDHFSSKILEQILARQEKDQSQEVIVAFDDVAVHQNLWTNDCVKHLIRYGSSLNITSVFSVQYLGQLDDVFKRNIDFVFLFRDGILQNQKMFYDTFGGMFPSFETFKVVHDECIAEPYRCLVIDFLNPKKDAKDAVFWYKAPPLSLVKETNSKAKHINDCPWYSYMFEWFSKSK